MAGHPANQTTDAEPAADGNPRIKEIYPRYRLDDRRFRIGAQLGITAEFDDAGGEVWDLAESLDGRPVPEVVAAVRRRHPHLSVSDVLDGIATLDHEGFVESAAPGGHTEDDFDARLLPNIRYFSRFEGIAGNRYRAQQRLQDSTVLLLGLGGAGSNFLTLLSGVGVGRVIVADHDSVEAANLGRQLLYREKDIGVPKATAAADALGQMNSRVEVRPHVRKVDSAEDVTDLLDGVDLVICAIDEPPFIAQRRVNAACVARNVPCVYGLSQVTRGRVFTVVPGVSGCFDCLNINYSQKDPVFVAQFRGFMRSGWEAPSIAYAPALFQLSAVAVDEAVRVLTGYAPPRSVGVQFEIDYEEGTAFHLNDWPRLPELCPTCGTGTESDWEVFREYREGA
ncbi:ThiF family adenylyltransferase [Nonomuraea fuscirosea]|uniref:ThiF family adenylyltransferase n=1 Tax=Nonomuraea fuscirosea TaxID=1291556 RepID=UPI002DD90D12|nr:ThiF family adenylyltransferase [Nonomuraea fuscirosea]WSA52200.1 ThiF family adenylyltransferase [Nonomuraea fuscirosea]